MNKHELRQKMIEKLEELHQIEREEIEQQLVKHLLTSKLWQNAQTIGVTISQGVEWSTEPIIKSAWQVGKRVCVPKCYPKKKALKFYHLTSYDELEVVYYRLQEPDPERTTYIHKNNIDLLIVPGLLYNEEGYRIGFGGGYYDRFLVNFPHTTVSLASQHQVMEKMPVEPHDICVDYVITEKGFIK